MRGSGLKYVVEKYPGAEGENPYNVCFRLAVPRIGGKVFMFNATYRAEDRRREFLANTDPMNYGKANGYRVYCLYEGYGLTPFNEEDYDGDFRLMVHDELCRMADWYVANKMSAGQRAGFRDNVPLRETFRVDPVSGHETGAKGRYEPKDE